MTESTEVREIKRLSGSIVAVLVAAVNTLPTYLLGLLGSAIGRHPNAERELADEPGYRLLVWWQGGAKSFGLVSLLLFLLLFCFFVSYVMKAAGYSERGDGMGHGRLLVKQVLIPAWLSFAAFAGGLFGGEAVSSMVIGLMVPGLFVAFAALVHYFIDI